MGQDVLPSMRARSILLVLHVTGEILPRHMSPTPFSGQCGKRVSPTIVPDSDRVRDGLISTTIRRKRANAGPNAYKSLNANRRRRPCVRHLHIGYGELGEALRSGCFLHCSLDSHMNRSADARIVSIRSGSDARSILEAVA